MAPNTRSSTRKRKAPKDSQANTTSLPRARRPPKPPRTEIRSVESHQESTRSVSDLLREAEANVDLNTTSDTDLGIHRQETTPPQGLPLHARVRRPTDKTFRLRGIPKEWDKAEVQRRVKDRLSLGDNEAVVVRSLSENPHRHEERVATIEFPRIVLTELGDNEKSEWRIMIEGHELLLDIHFFGMTPLHAADDSSCDVDVIALSGLNGHAFGSFKSKSNVPTYMWLRDSLQSDIPHARIFIYGYDTQTIDSDCFQNIGDIGQQLKSDLVLMRKTTGSSKRHLILIGHSLGGIIIKSAINKMSNRVEIERDIAKSICSVLFFGVPNQGMDIRSLIPMVGDRPNRELLQSLGMESEVLQNLSQSFQTSLDSQHSRVFSFYETRQSPTANKADGKWTMSGPATVLVDRRSATNGRNWEQDDEYCYPINRTHSEMVKLDSRHDAVYAQALHCLKGYQESSKTNSTVLSKDQQECLKSLSFPEQTLRLDDIHTATNTCNWLLRHGSYQAWINDPSGLLWIEGAPGVGKSVLMKHALQILNEKFSEEGYLLLSFFVHGQGSVLQRSNLGLLRAILHQLLRQKPDAFSLVLPKYDERCRTMESWQWSEKELQALLQKCLESACQSTHAILLVDALDELSEDIAREVVEYFQNLIDSLSKHASNLRICFSCRHYPNISFNDGYRICVERENSDDIRYVVHSKLAKIFDFNTIPSLITENANGVFQWAVLVSDKARKLAMDHKMLNHIRQEIQTLPKSLHDLYSGLLKDAPQVTLRLFQWICFANGRLDPVALRKALSVSIEQSCSSLQQYEEILGFEDSEEGVSSMIETLSKGLAKVIQPPYTRGRVNDLKVNLIHESVRDFLIHGGFECMERSLSINPVGLSNAQLSGACLRFLAAPESQQNINRLPILLYSRSAEPDFDEYAFYNWASHALRAEEMNCVPDFLLRYFDATLRPAYRKPENGPESRPSECHTINPCRLFRNYAGNYEHDLSHSTTLVHLLSQNNLKLLLRHVIDRGHMLDIKNESGHTPLCVAAIERHSGVTKLLLETGQVNPDCQDNKGRTPLSYAAAQGPLDLVKILLASPRVDPNRPDNIGWTPLLYATEFADPEVVKHLIECSQVNPNHQDHKGQTPFLRAAIKSRQEIVIALLKLPNINVNSKDVLGRTPLSHVATWIEQPFSRIYIETQLKVVNELLSIPNIKVDSKDATGRTPLSHAAENGSLKVIEALIGLPEVDADSQDYEGRTPLSYASENCHREVVATLLRNGCNPNTKDKKGRTPHSYEVNQMYEKRWSEGIGTSNAL